MSKPEPPAPPNPVATAAAQTGTNVSTAVANAFLNNTNQVTPQGSLTYDPTGSYSWTDPSTGNTYNIPRFTATQTLSPQQTAIQGQTQQTQLNLAQMSNEQSARIKALLSNPLDVSNAPQGGDPSTIGNVPGAVTSFDAAGNPITDFGPSGQITTSYGPQDSFSADRQRVEDALMARLDPQLNKDRAALEQRLADQGIRYGSPAYAAAMDELDRQKTDARFAAIAQGGTEQQRLAEMAAQQAAFQNAAQQQGYEQQLGRAGFTNQALGQLFQQNAARATFQNAGLAQQIAQAQSAFNAQQAARNQALQQAFALRNQPINEITSLLSGSQVQQPNFLNTPQSQIPTTDFAGITNAAFQNQMGIYNAQMNQYNSIMGGILGAGGNVAGMGIYKYSDRRLKQNIRKMGTVLSATTDSNTAKLPIYSYAYKSDPTGTQHTGPMAQDVEKIDPGAVRKVGGARAINVPRVMGNILKAA